ncbi:MAG: hypothetical protein J6M31_04505 [Bacteroidales bacterium]|nr:hypothetical protein [Bacteroidales bacterium]
MSFKSIFGGFAVLILLSGASCEQVSRFSFENSTLIKTFPVEIKEIPESGISVLDIDATGVLGVKILNDILLISSRDKEQCISAYLFSGEKYLKSFLATGRGPGEVLYTPYISWLSFYSLGDTTQCMGFYDFKGGYFECNIPASLAAGSMIGEQKVASLSVSSGARYFRINADSLLCRKSNDKGTGYVRFITDKRGERMSHPSMEDLNRFSSSFPNDLSTLIMVNEKANRIVELGSGLPVIHLYSIHGSYAKSLHIGEYAEISNIESNDGTIRKRYYYDAKQFEEGFAGLFLNCTNEQIDENDFPNPEVHVFSWTGEPIARIRLPIRALSFDIDYSNRMLYLVDEETEQILLCKWG